MMGVAGIAAITLAPLAHADPYDDNDVSAYAAQSADFVCQIVNGNPTVAGIEAALDQVHQASGFSILHSGTIVNLAVRGKCPQHFGLLHEY